jgi:hypothetical protein
MTLPPDGVAVSSMPLKLAVPCQIVPVVFDPKKRVPVELDTGSAHE